MDSGHVSYNSFSVASSFVFAKTGFTKRSIMRIWKPENLNLKLGSLHPEVNLFKELLI